MRFNPLTVILVASLLNGCATVGTFQRADTLGKGGYAIGIEPSVWGGSAGGQAAVLPNFAVSARFGLSDRFDLGTRIGSSGIEVLSKYQFTSRDSDGLVLSLAPSFGGFFAGGTGGGAGIIAFQIPFLIGVPVGKQSQFVLGPKLHYYGVLGGGSGVSAGGGFLSLGTSVGFDAAINHNVHLLPEISFAYPLLITASANDGNGNNASDSASTSGTLFFQAGLSIQIGKLNR